MKKSSKKILFFGMVSIFVFSSLYFYMKTDTSEKKLAAYKTEVNNVTNMTIPSANLENKITYLQQKYQNEDIKATISIDNDDFTYPVVQTTDNDYYLTHDYSKKNDSLGSIYADYRVNIDGGKKILIFGHSSISKQTPFNHLENYYNESYFQNHRYLTLETKNNTYHYEIFSVHVETTDFTYMNLNFDSNLKWYAHLKKLQERSWYQTSITLSENDDILILQTCSNLSKYKNDSKKYLLIVSRRVK